MVFVLVSLDLVNYVHMGIAFKSIYVYEIENKRVMMKEPRLWTLNVSCGMACCPIQWIFISMIVDEANMRP